MRADEFLNGGGPNLDELLKQSFLDLDQTNPANDKLFDMASQNVFGTEWPGQVNAGKEAQLTKSAKSGLKWPWFLAGAFVTGVLVTGVAIFSGKDNVNAKGNAGSALSELSSKEKIIPKEKYSPFTFNQDQNEKQESNAAQNDAYAKETKTNHVGDPLQSKHSRVELKKNNLQSEVILPAGSSNGSGADDLGAANAQVNTDYLSNVPATSVSPEEENPLLITDARLIEEIKKEKEKLAKEVTMNLSMNYAPIQASSKTGYSGLAYQKSFFMKMTEVTVREYKTFLNDLLIQGKKDEYEIARPKYDALFSGKDQKKDRQFFDEYFSNPYYKNYPVVFISTDGANLYCRWLQDLIIAAGGEKYQLTSVRLPNESEWEKAAMGGLKNPKFATTNGKLKNTFGRTYQANFKETQENDFRFNVPLTASDVSTLQMESVMEHNNTKENKRKNRFTCHVRDYEPNGFGIFNMSGNVSEMVKDKNGNIITKGGNWNSKIDYLQIDFEDEFMGGVTASPYIGFRPVITLK